VRDLNHEVLRESRTYDATRNLREKWIVDLMHDQPDHRGGPAGQLPCVDIRYVAEIMCHVANLLGKRYADPRLAIERPRSGSQRDTGGCRYVTQQHGA
jgi:hypothetical protein